MRKYSTRKYVMEKFYFLIKMTLITCESTEDVLWVRKLKTNMKDIQYKLNSTRNFN